MNIPYMVYLGENHRCTFVTYTDVFMLPMQPMLTICHIYMYAIHVTYDYLYMPYTNLYMSHTYTYTYVTYLHKHI